MATRAEVQDWVGRYERAWRTAGTEALAGVFTEGATYLHSPYAQPVAGLAAIGEMWEADRNGPGEVFTLSTEVLAVDGDTAVVRALVRYGSPMRQEYTDLWIVELDGDGRCSRFEEWPYWPGRPWSARASARLLSYPDTAGRSDVLSGGVRLLPVSTPKGDFRVWTKRVGNNPTAKLLLLHGGPGATHEYFECCDTHLPGAGIEYYLYDQLGSAYSDQPDEPDLLEIDRFVDEVEQVRVALGLDSDNFFLLGHSWGGILAIEYALRHQQHLKGLVISNMMASIPAYNEYADRVLKPAMDQQALAEIERLEKAGDYANPRYMELLVEHHYVQHVLRMPAADWPDPVNRAFAHINQSIYVPMQGPSELGASGKLAAWDRVDDLQTLTVPTLVIGARHDTMDPAHMEMMAGRLPHGRYLLCLQGSHMSMYDDQLTYFDGVVGFIQDVDARSALS